MSEFDRLAARHKEWSVIASADDEVAGPNQRLIDLTMVAASTASREKVRMDDRTNNEPDWTSIWPGEHYRLLLGLVRALQPSTVIEIGTFTGMGSLAILQALPETAKLRTFDIVPWDQIPNTHLRSADFNERFQQVVADVSAPNGIEPYRALFEDADFVFIDGPKDGVTEARILLALETLHFRKSPIVMFDDIRVMTMIGIWRAIAKPKLDISSFGHWSGTGLIDWTAALVPEAPLMLSSRLVLERGHSTSSVLRRIVRRLFR